MLTAHHRSRRLPTLLGASLILAMVVAAGPAQAAQPRASAYPPLRVQANIGSPYLQNFNLCNPNAYGNQGGTQFGTIYETLYTVDYAKYIEHPMLATSYTWSKDLKTLTFTIRQGVKWSDGQPFTAKDGYFTLWTLPQTSKVCGFDEAGTRNKPGNTVTMPSPNQVAIHFPTVDVTRFFSLVNGSWIVPEHIYRPHLKDIATWANPNPVGTGPFPNLANFTPQTFDLNKNAYYWQPGKPAFDTIRLQNFTSTIFALFEKGLRHGGP